MEYDKEKVDEYTLALLFLVMHDENEHGARAWKGFDWDTMNRLHERLHRKSCQQSKIGCCHAGRGQQSKRAF